MLVGRVGIDQHGVVVERLALELVGDGEHTDHVFDAQVGDRQRDLDVGLDIAVEDEIDAGAARQRVEHRLQVGVAKVERHRLAQLGFQGRRLGIGQQLGRRELVVELAFEQLGTGVGGVFCEHLAQELSRVIATPLGQGQLCLFQTLLLTAQQRNGVDAGAGAVVGRIERERALVAGLGVVELIGIARGVGLFDVFAGQGFALTNRQHAVLGVVGLERQGLVDLRQPGFGLTLVNQLLAAAHQIAARRASRQQQGDGKPAGRGGPGKGAGIAAGGHGVFPSRTTWACLRGRKVRFICSPVMWSTRYTESTVSPALIESTRLPCMKNAVSTPSSSNLPMYS